MDPKKSIVVSVFTLCLPGLIYNLDKFRQVECIYGTCLLNVRDAPGAGTETESVPLSMCEEQKGYLKCKYVMGEIFNVIPMTAAVNYYIGLVKNALGDPLSIFGAVWAATCVPQCTEGKYHWPWNGCAYGAIASMVGAIADDIFGFSKTAEASRCGGQ